MVFHPGSSHRHSNDNGKAQQGSLGPTRGHLELADVTIKPERTKADRAQRREQTAGDGDGDLIFVIE